MALKYWVRSAVILAGFNALAAQILFLREFFILFRGGELALGFLLACWLGWTALGSILGGKFLHRKEKANTWSILHFLQTLSIPVTLLLISSNRLISQALPGESLSIEKAMIFAVIETAVFCVLTGMLFSAGSHLYASLMKMKRSASTSQVYFYETLGAGLSGLMVTAFLILHVDDMFLAVIISTVNIIYLYFFVREFYPQNLNRRILPLYLMTMIFLAWTPAIKSGIIAQSWQPLQIDSRVNSKFGEWIVVRLENEFTFYHNGMVMFTLPDPAAAEENVHYALLQHPAPRDILMIGGGLNGGLVEALKHPSIESITYLELDPQAITLIRQLNLSIPDDPRIKFYFQDGRHFLQNTDHTYDVILCNTPEPANAQLNRFYTKEFFSVVKNHLNEGGLLALRVEGSENFINKDHARYLSSLYLTLKMIFNDVGYIPGDVIHFFASTKPNQAKPSADLLIKRLQARQISSTFVREYFIPFRLMPDRIELLDMALNTDDLSLINSDLFPKTYYLNSIFRGSKFLSPIFALIKSWSKNVTFLFLGGFILIFFIISCFIKPLNKSAGLSSVFIMGLTLMGFEVTLLISFQSLFGFVYFEIALLTGTMMLGMAAGTWIALVSKRKIQYGYINLLLTLLAVLVFEFYFILMSRTIQGWLTTYQSLGSLVFFLFAFLCGGLGGLIFPAATTIYYQNKDENRSNIGVIYSADLSGALLGSALPASLLFPVIGLANSMLFLLTLNLVTILALILRRKMIR